MVGHRGRIVASFLLSAFDTLTGLPSNALCGLGIGLLNVRKARPIISEAIERSSENSDPELSTILERKGVSKRVLAAILSWDVPENAADNIIGNSDPKLVGNLARLIADVQSKLRRTEVYQYLDSQAFRAYSQSWLADIDPRTPIIQGESHNPGPMFVGRAPEIGKIRELVGMHNVTFVTGDGGIGKSEVCRKLTTELESEDACHVVWTTFRSNIRDTLMTSTRIYDPDGRSACWDEERSFEERLSSLADPSILLVVDDLDRDVDDDEDYERLLHLPCRKLITTRRRIPPNFASVTIPPLDDEEALEVVRNAVEIEYRGYIETNRRMVSEIAHMLENHTLTLTILGGLVNNGGIGTIRKVRDLFEGELSNRIVPDDVPMRETTVVGRICRLYSTAELDDSVRDALRKLSLLPLDDVPSGYLDRLVPLSMEVKRVIERGRWVSVSYDGSGGLVSMHALVREALRHTLQPTVLNCADVIGNINELFASKDRDSRMARNHVTTMFGSIAEVLCDYEFRIKDGEGYRTTIAAVASFGKYDIMESRYLEAERFLKGCLEMESRLRPRDRGLRFEMRIDLAMCLCINGKPRESVDVLNGATRLCHPSDDSYELDVYRVLCCKATTYGEMSFVTGDRKYLKYSKRNFEKALKLQKNLDLGIRDLIELENNFGTLLMDMGLLEEAIGRFDVGLGLCQTDGAHAPMSDLRMTLEINKSIALTLLSEFDRSLECLNSAHSTAMNLLPETHRFVGMMYKTYGLFYSSRMMGDDPTYAVASYAMSLDILGDVFVTSHPFIEQIEWELDEVLLKRYRTFDPEDQNRRSSPGVPFIQNSENDDMTRLMTESPAGDGRGSTSPHRVLWTDEPPLT